LARGALWGLASWNRTFRRLVRSKDGPRIVLAVVVVLAVAMVALWWTLHDLPLVPRPTAVAFLRALPFAGLATYLVPALLFAGLGVARQVLRSRQKEENP
jgi:hypothetical protein